ncbi:protein of unknown function (plasmid) [Azospirillum baldaniorum]|uniref:Uncharacterized protein n=1 Tax=Azospirillum baldaniorum TaxID=1064539 RepID=A0A9P1JWC3_9PROT|nr:protein of unknown function [Azospirillum baldaniorum]
MEAPMTATLDVLTGWPARLDELFGRISSEFARAEPRRQARKYLEGLLGGAKRKNGWQLVGRTDRRRPALAHAAGAQPCAVGPGSRPRRMRRLHHRAARP